jgi:hypothetical protein
MPSGLRLAASSPVPAHRALLGRVLASARLGRGDGDPEAFAPEWADAAVPVPASRWAADDFDLLNLDDEVCRCLAGQGRCELRVVDDGIDADRLAESALQVAIRYQRFDTSPNPASATPFFQQILVAHERLFERTRPASSAERDRALDTWRWLLRLEPHAGLSLQLAALFNGASVDSVAGVLESLQTPPQLIERARMLVEGQDQEPRRGGEEPAVALLADADALSFFSLEAPQFATCFPPAHTAIKVTACARRLDDEGRVWLARVKLTRAVRSLLREVRSDDTVPRAAAPEASAYARPNPPVSFRS